MTEIIKYGFGSFKDIITYLTSKAKTKDVIENNLLRELRDNIKLLEHRNSEGVNITAIIENLHTSAIDEAYKANFNFNNLTHKKTLQKEIVMNKRLEKYIGWDAKRFIYSIEGKLKDMRNLPKLYTDLKQAPINITLRLDNLFYQMILFTVLIKTASK